MCMVVAKQKKTILLSNLMESAEGENLLLGVAEPDNYKSIAAAAMAYKHSLIAQSPIDINIAKQLNILISEMSTRCSTGLSWTLPSLHFGYGLEYSYSIMERVRLGALNGDRMLCP